MAHEIELKLDAPAKGAARLPKAPWLEKLLSAPLQHKRVASVYFDTRSNKLHAAGISLRVRQIGDNTVAQLQEVARGLGIHLSDEHAASYHAMLQPNFDAYDLIDALPDFVPQVTYPRTPGYRPAGEENTAQGRAIQFIIRGGWATSPRRKVSRQDRGG